MTPIWVEGFEHGVLSVSGGGIVNALTGAPTISSSIKRTGGYSCRFYKTVASTCYFSKTIAGSPTYLVSRFYLYFTTLPASDAPIWRANPGAGGQPSITFIAATSQLRSDFNGSGNQLGPVITTGQWYLIETRAYVGGATRTQEWSVDSVAQPTSSASVAASSFASIRGGFIDLETGDMYFDDIVVSSTSGDYPIGPGGVVGLSPNAAGTSNPGTYIQDNGSVVVHDATNPANVELDDVPFNGADYIKQTELDVALYAEVNFADTAQATIHGAQAFLAYTSAAATANNGQTRIRDSNGQETTVYANDMSETAMFYKSAIVLTPSGGWTMAHVNALTGRVGYSSDATPDPYWQGLIIQVAYGEVAATPINVTDVGSGADIVASVLARITLTDAGAGADIVAEILRRCLLADSGAGVDALAALNAALVLLESGVGIDSGAVKALLAIAESGIGVDVEDVHIQGEVKEVFDSGSGVDVLAAVKAILTILESGIGVDLASGRALLSVFDVAAGVDGVTIKAPVLVTDLGVAEDLLSILRGVLASDAGLGLDSISATVKVPLMDSGMGADLASVFQAAGPKFIVDSGSGSDAFLLTARVQIVESALGTDGIIVKLSLTIQDVGAGLDLAAMKGIVFAQDVGLTSEVLSLLGKIQVTDSGVLEDAVAELKNFLTVADLGVGLDSAAVIEMIQKLVTDAGAGLDVVRARSLLALIITLLSEIITSKMLLSSIATSKTLDSEITSLLSLDSILPEQEEEE